MPNDVIEQVTLFDSPPAETPEQPEAPSSPSVDYEAAARAEGWKSKEELGDAFDPIRHVNAEEFIKRKPLFDTIRQQSKAIKELKKTIDSVVQFSKQNADLEVKKAIENLNAQKREAIGIGDIETVEKIDKSIKLHEDAAKKAAEVAPSVPPEVLEWTEKNKWFDEDMEMQDFATAYCASYAKRNPSHSIEKALSATEVAVKKAFSDSKYFVSSRKTAAPIVESRPGGASPGGSSKYSMARLTDIQKRTYDAYVRKSKMMSHDQFFEKLEEIGALEK